MLLPISVGVANVYRSYQWPKKLDAIKIAAWINKVSAILLAIIILIIVPKIDYLLDLPNHIYGLLALQMIAAGVSQLFAFILQHRSGPVYISQAGSVVTVFGGVLGVLIFDEMYSAHTVIGSVLVLIGVFAYSLNKSLRVTQTIHAVRLSGGSYNLDGFDDDKRQLTRPFDKSMSKVT